MLLKIRIIFICHFDQFVLIIKKISVFKLNTMTNKNAEEEYERILCRRKLTL